jgi:hypothetical protein
MRICVAQPAESNLSARGEENGFLERLKAAVRRTAGSELVTSADAAEMVIVSEDWRNYDWRDIGYLESCPFIRRQAQKLIVISHKDVSVTFFPGLYVSLTERNHWRDWSVPCGYKNQIIARKLNNLSAYRQPHLLFSFRGADFSSTVRQTLNKLYSQRSDICRYTVMNKKFGSHNEVDQETYFKEMLASKFILAPGGWSPSTYRLFEAMEYGICPVIISDDWQPIPDINWDSCSIRIPESKVGFVEDILKERSDDANILGTEARKVWEANFDDGIREEKMLQKAIVLHKNTAKPRDIQSLSYFWQSRQFRNAHSWTIRKRIKTRAVILRDQLIKTNWS